MKINYNRKYTTIALYTIVVVFVLLIVYRFTFTWDDSIKLVTNFLSLMSPFIFALFIAYFISPMVNFFEVKIIGRLHIKERYLQSARLKRVLSIIFSYLVVLGTLIFLLAIIIPQLVESVYEIADNLPDYVQSVLRWAQSAQFTIGENSYVIDLNLVNTFVEDSLPQTLEQITEIFNRFVPDILNFTRNIANAVLNLLFGFIVAIYLLFNKEAYIASTRKIITALMPAQHTKSFFYTLTESHKIFSNFFVGKLIDSIIIGIICFVITLIAKIPYALLISVIVGVTNMIPYFGPFIGGGIGVIFLLMSSPVKALWFGLIIIALQQFDGNILGPKILGDSTGLTPFWVIFAIILFGGMFGLLGMFIGVPCFAVIKNVFDNVIDRRYREKMALTRESPNETMSL